MEITKSLLPCCVLRVFCVTVGFPNFLVSLCRKLVVAGQVSIATQPVANGQGHSQCHMSQTGIPCCQRSAGQNRLDRRSKGKAWVSCQDQNHFYFPGRK